MTDKTTAVATKPKPRAKPKAKSAIIAPSHADIPSSNAGLSLAQASSSEWNSEGERAKAAMAAQHYINDIELIESMSIGTYRNVPRGAENWHFIRCGRRGDPRAEAMKGKLMRMGFRPAPPQLRCLGFEKEGADGLYVCCPPETHAKIRAAKAKLKRAAKKNVTQSFDSMLRGSMSSLSPNIQIGEYDS